jgi:XTP/dITP diphosphohydrolase
MKQIFYATNNPGKIFEVGRQLASAGIKMITPNDLGLTIDVEENGNTLEENAILKIKGYLDLLKDMIILADDTGLEIDALNGEPGIHVRRWKDGKTRMTDQECIDYCIEMMKGIPKENRGAQFRTVLALSFPNKDIELFDGILRGHILEEPSILRVEGFPYESLFMTDVNTLLGDDRQIPLEERKDRPSHRERAVYKIIERLNKDIF